MQQGVNIEKLARLFQDRYGLIVSIARRYAPSPDLAYDVVQQSFIDFIDYARKNNIDPDKDVMPLLYRIVKFRAIKLWKDRAKRTGDVYELIAEQLAERSRDEDFEEIQMLRFCLEKLPPQSRELVEQYYFQERTLGEIARQKHRSDGAIRQAFYTIRLKLRECIEHMLTRGDRDGP